MSGGWCRSYDKKVEHFLNLYPEVWGLIYQADVRTRNELGPKLRAEMQYRYSKDLANGTAHQNDFNPAMSWGSVFERIINGELKWWTDMVDRPGMCIITDAAKVTKYIDGYALTRKPGKRGQYDDGDRNELPPLKRRRAAGSGGGGTGSSSSWSHPYQNNAYEVRGGGANAGGAHPRMDPNTNLYTTTRAGHAVCRGYQNGTCTAGNNGKCGRDSTIAHRCGVCLMVGHAAWEQAKCPKQGGGPNPGAGAGRGRGRARARGRGPGRGGKAWGRGGKAE